VDAAFERDTNGTEADWLRWLPAACGAHPLSHPAPDQAEVAIGAGRLLLHWRVLPPRRIALVQLPRLAVRYQFEQVDETVRAHFMRHFDLVMQRGGG
jgi:hypothetical protein